MTVVLECLVNHNYNVSNVTKHWEDRINSPVYYGHWEPCNIIILSVIFNIPLLAHIKRNTWRGKINNRMSKMTLLTCHWTHSCNFIGFNTPQKEKCLPDALLTYIDQSTGSIWYCSMTFNACVFALSLTPPSQPSSTHSHSWAAFSMVAYPTWATQREAQHLERRAFGCNDWSVSSHSEAIRYF